MVEQTSKPSSVSKAIIPVPAVSVSVKFENVPIPEPLRKKLKEKELRVEDSIEFTFPYGVSDDMLTLSIIEEPEILHTTGIIGNKLVPTPLDICPNGQVFWMAIPNKTPKVPVPITVKCSAISVWQWFYDVSNGVWRWENLNLVAGTSDTWKVITPCYCFFCRN